MKITIKLSTLILVLTSLAIGIPLVLAADVTVQGTGGNVAPTVGAVEFNDTTPAAGVAFYVSAEVNDQNGQSGIYDGNITCVGTGGTEGTDSWDSIKLLNSSLVWTSVNTTAYRFNGTFTTSVNYWSTKSVNGTWTCKVYANDTTGSSVSNSNTMTVDTSVGITVAQATCVFDSANPGQTDKQWACPDSSVRNNTITHNGNINVNVTTQGTDLTGVTDNTWKIVVGNITWNATYSPNGGTLPGTVLTTSAADLITKWLRGASSTSNTTNTTAWLDYPLILKAQTYEGTITLTSFAQ